MKIIKWLLTGSTLGPTISSRTSQAPTLAAIEEQEPKTPQEAFIYETTHAALKSSENLSTSSEWYVSFLECKIREAWDPLFRPVLVDISSKEEPNDADIAIAFELLTAIILEFNRRDLALIEIVDELYNKKLLKETDSERAVANQLVFAAFGWISMLPLP